MLHFVEFSNDTRVIEAQMPLDRTSRIKMYKNNARSRLFCRMAKRSINEKSAFEVPCPPKFEILDTALSRKQSVVSSLRINGTDNKIKINIATNTGN